MAVILEVKAGAFAGKRVAVMAGQTVTVGRTNRANFAVPHDTFMSGLHFSVECGPKGCVLTDQKSSNGTFVNETRVTQTLLKSGDEIRSGQTVFVVRIVDEEPIQPGTKPATPAVSPPQPAAMSTPQPPAINPLPPLAPRPVKPPDRTTPLDDSVSKARPSAPAMPPRPQAPLAPPKPMGKPILTVGGWTFAAVPEKWIAQADFGLQRDVPDSFPSSIVVTEEQIGEGLSLHQYVDAQLGMLRQYLREPQIDAALPPKIYGADETVAVEVRYKTKDGQGVFYRRIYSRLGRTVGVLTFTTLENELAQVRPALDAIISGAGFRPPAASQV
jgi:predicted component of type VI protein secretion system